MRAIAALMLAAAALSGQDLRVVLLGTGTPNPEPEHSGPAVAVISGGNVYIVDCGPGVVRRAAQAGIRMDQLTRAFVTHLHSDHTTGLPDLIFTPAVTGRKTPFDIYGPPGLSAMVRHVMSAWKEDMDIRLHGLEPSVKDAYTVHAHDVKPGEIYRDSSVRVTAIAVAHGSWKHAYGYRFDAGGKSVVISGDTTLRGRRRNSFSSLLRGISEKLLHRDLRVADHTAPRTLHQTITAFTRSRDGLRLGIGGRFGRQVSSAFANVFTYANIACCTRVSRKISRRTCSTLAASRSSVP